MSSRIGAFALRTHFRSFWYSKPCESNLVVKAD